MSYGPLGFAPNEHREGGDIVKQDFIAGDGREGRGGNKKAGCIFNITPASPQLFI